MSKKEDSLPDRRNPSVAVIIDGDRKVNTSYKNCEIFLNKDNNKNISEFLNKTLELINNRFDYIVFLGNKFDFKSGTTIDTLVTFLERKDKSIYIGVYTDVTVLDAETTLNLYNPSYNPYILDSGVILNFPFIVRGGYNISFTDGLKSLYLYDGILDINSKYMLYHIPSSMFVMENGFNKAESFSEDLNKIKNERNKNNSSSSK